MNLATATATVPSDNRLVKQMPHVMRKTDRKVIQRPPFDLNEDPNEIMAKLLRGEL